MGNTSVIIPLVRNIFIGPAIPKIALSATMVNAKYCTKAEAFIETRPYKLHRLDKGPEPSVTLTSNEALKMFTTMVYIRRLEFMGNSLYKSALIRGFLHLYSGQEAVAAGIKPEIRDKDNVTGAYRIHGWAYVSGVSLKGVLAELMFRKTGCSRAKGGSMHMYTKAFFGGNGIVGAQLSIGTGAALAHKLRDTGGISWTLYGDGSANVGQCAEVMNISKLWGLPCIYVCENNHYAMGTRDDRGSANTDYYTRGDLIPGVWIDGMDVISTREAARFAVEYVTNTKGPIILEMETYRYFGHSMSDPGMSYRTHDEVQTMRKTRDPINSFKEKIIKAGLATVDQLKAIELQAKKDVDVAAAEAKADPFADVSELTADIYELCLEPDQNIRGRVPNAPFKHINNA